MACCSTCQGRSLDSRGPTPVSPVFLPPSALRCVQTHSSHLTLVGNNLVPHSVWGGAWNPALIQVANIWAPSLGAGLPSTTDWGDGRWEGGDGLPVLHPSQGAAFITLH